MGASGSKKHRQPYPVAQSGSAAPGSQPPPAPGARPIGAAAMVPQDAVPWTGPQVQYTLLNVNVQMHHNMNFNFASGVPLMSSNVDSYYPHLAQMYAQGYELTSFYRIPGAQQMRGMFSMGVDVAFQGIFVRDVHPSMAPFTGPRYQLRIEKSLMQTQRVFTGLFTTHSLQQSDTADMHQKIVASTQNGGRLVCVELTGSSMTQGHRAAMMGAQMIQGVDLFFHVPMTPGAPNYSIQCVSVPIPMKVGASFGGTNIQFNIDWCATLGQYLNQGWKLVEIFLDQAQSTSQGGFMSANITMHSVWFFEKDTTLLEDLRPKYQGCVVPYQHKISTGFGGSNAQGNWAPLLEQMGQHGWELACILETPNVRMTGLTSVKMDLLFFFQRPMNFTLNTAIPPPMPALPSPDKGYDAPPTTYPDAAPPTYHDAVDGQGTSGL